MLDHHIQRALIYQLAFTSQARFSELKPSDIESKLFTYHLKKVITAGYVFKTQAGLYELTPHGRRLGLEALKSDQSLLDKAYSLLLLVVRRKSDGAWLLYTRQKHPLIGLVGFPQARPLAGLNAMKAASQTLQQKTTLQGSFQALGSGYFHMFEGNTLESFINFTLLTCDDVQGDLQQNDDHGIYEWVQNPNFTSKNMLPSMQELVNVYEKGELFFIDKTFSV